MENKNHKDGYQKHKVGCPDYTKITAYANLSLSKYEEESIEKILNNCSDEDCLCAQILEGLQLAKYAEKLVQKDPKLAEGLDEEALLKKIRPLIPIKMLDNSPTLKVHKNEFQKKNLIPNRNIWGWLAAAVLLLAIVWAMNQWNNNTINPNEIADKDSTQVNDSSNLQKKIIEKNPIAEEKKDFENNKEKINEKKNPIIEENKNDLPENLLAYEPNISLDLMIEGKRRSVDGPVLRKILPDNTIKPKNEITFSWEQNTNRLELIIEILDNKAESVKTFEVPKREKTLTANLKDFKNGLYYWRILDEESGNVLHTGKFVLKR